MVAADGQTGRRYNRISKQTFYVGYGRRVKSAQVLEGSLVGVETVLRFDRDAWSMVK